MTVPPSVSNNDTMTARTVTIGSRDGTDIEAYLVTADDAGRRGGVVVIHHMPGYDRSTKEIARRFAELGYDALCPNLYWRQAPGAEPSDAAAAVRSQGGLPDTQLVDDVAGAATYLRGQEWSNGKVGVIGYCSGGRQSVLAACRLDLEAAVDCYGALVVGEPPQDSPLKIKNLVDDLPNLSSPLLGLFGNDDKNPGPKQVDELDQRLNDLGKPHEFHRYDDAGHGFFSPDRPSYRVAAVNDGWERIEDFFGTHLS